MCPWKYLGLWGRSMAIGQGPGPWTQPDPSLGDVLPTLCLVCLTGRPSHNLGGVMLEPGTGSGLLHRNRVTGVDACTPSCLYFGVWLDSLLFFLKGSVVTGSGGPDGGLHPFLPPLEGSPSTHLTP